jgi:TP901 family phage tail tape measure protein
MAIDLDVHGNTKPLEAAVQAAVNRIRRTPIKITVDDKGATQPLGNMKRAADEFSKSMEAANARILAFGASMAIINGVADAFKGMVRNMVEVEKSLADINVVMGLSAQNLDKFGDGLFKVAKETGAAFRVAADAATEYARQGLSVEESLKRTRDALVLTRLTGMDSAEAVKSLTAAMNTYGNQIKDTTQLVSKFAAVDVQFAVSAEDFAAAISRTGQAAKTAGVDIDELIGIVTSAQQQTARGGAVIGNALKTIFTKTGRTDTLNQLEDLGIAVRDLEGNTIGAKRILTELANTFDHLSESQKAQITQTMGGLFHINILKAVLSDAAKQNGILARATEISAGATDEAIQKNQQLRETMSALATETGLAIKQVSSQIGEIALAPGMEKILNTVKSLAEGLSGVLGDGESVGSKFANGFLKGIGNIITGPGLVILTAVFFKLFGQALKFTRESLTSLVGVTTEKQKQKAIETSLVALFGQNAALNKEMLRTDISRTEKEKILLGLLKAQVAEASRLSKLTGGMAASLYRQGYGANLMPIGKKRAYGHIPNFAHPERVQAAQGGYAAGNIRSMNMPGEGSVIYNSAEKIKNFAGFKQPAIMPPLSSKAGKNYQQAFGSVHGFDPYAAEGFIPNFALTPGQILNNALTAKRTTNLTKIASGEKISGQSFSQEQRNAAAAALQRRSGKNKSTAATSDLMRAKFPLLNPGGAQYVLLSASPGPEPGRASYYVGNETMLSRGMSDRAYIHPSKFFNKEGRMLKGVNARKVDVPIFTLDAKDKNLKSPKNKGYQTQIYDTLKKTGQGLTNRILRQLGMGKYVGKRDILDNRDVSAMGGNIFEAVIGSVLGDEAFKDYAGRGATARIDLPYDPELYKLFGVDKSSVKAALGAEAKISGSNDNAKDAARKFYDMLMGGRAATGFIPNFANPLSDAIGRERAAGVPVSQIRVGSHNALMSKGNPLGLGVTNTKDEPNGLRDVFGASGFVPNYAANLFKASDIESSKGNRKEREKLVKKINQELLKDLKRMPKDRRSQEKLTHKIEKIGKEYDLNASAVKRVTKANQTMGYRMTQGLKNMGRGNAGMALMMGMPIAAGFLGGDDPTSKVGGGLSGAMMGAATGASMGMMLPGFGTAIGAAVGGLYGLYSGLRDAQKAVEEKAAADRQAAEQQKRQQNALMASSLSQAFMGTSPSQLVPAGTFTGGVAEITSIGAGGKSYLETFDALARGAKGKASPVAKELESLSGMQPLSLAAMDPNKIDLVKAESTFNKFEEIRRKIAENKNKNKTTSDIAREQESNRKKKTSTSRAPTSIHETIAKSETRSPTLTPYANAVVAEADKLTKVDLLKSMFSAEKSQKFFSDNFQQIFGKSEISGAEILKQLPEMETEQIEALFQEIYNGLKQQRDAQLKYTDAVIKQFNMQKASLNAQDKFNQNMHKVNQHFATLSNQYAYREQTMGRFMSQSQKNELNYNKSLTKINETYAKTITKNTGQARLSLLSKLKDPKFAQGMKNLGITEEDVGKMNLEELKEYAGKIKQITGEEGAIKAILDASAKSLENKNQEASRALEISIQEAENQKAIADEILRQRTGPQAFRYGFAAEQTKMRESAAELDHQLGGIVATNFRDGLVSGMRAAINQAEDLGDVLQNVAMNFLQAIQSAYLTAAANQIVGAIPMPGIQQSRTLYRGGGIRNYSRGGGVPAMVTNGEYVMSGNAVSKYGGAFMHSLNAGGKIPGFSNGGSAVSSNFGGGRGYKSGRAYQSRAMSGFFYSQSGNVGIGEDREALLGVLAEEERQRQAAAAKKAKRKALWKQLLGTALSAGISYGVGKIGQMGKFKPGSVGEYGTSTGRFEMDHLHGADLASGKAAFSYLGGPIRKYASGGYISGKSGIDQIPAMLSEGEYVIRASSARQLGKPMLDQINAGKFNDGGAVTELSNKSETSPSSGNTNNINISINMDRGGSSQKSKDSSGQNPAERSTEEQNSAALADRIKQQVVAVIVEEQRPGGLLNEKS